jgi:cytochrome c-type biogenesis protein CcmH/NrfG
MQRYGGDYLPQKNNHDVHTNRKELEMKKTVKVFVLCVAVVFVLAIATGFYNEVRCEEHPKADTSVTETPKVEHPKAEHPSVEHPKVEQPNVEKPKVEQPQVEHPKAEHPKAEHPSSEHPK